MIEWILTDNNSSIFECIMILLIVAMFVVMILSAFSSFDEDDEAETRGKIACSIFVV